MSSVNESDTESTGGVNQADTTQEIQTADSSDDSGESSDSPDSGSGSSQSSTGSGTSITDESDGASSDAESVGDQSVESGDLPSDKKVVDNSAVVPLSQADNGSRSPVFATPMGVVPVKHESASPSLLIDSAASPVLATPAKGLVFDDVDDAGPTESDATTAASGSANLDHPVAQPVLRPDAAPPTVATHPPASSQHESSKTPASSATKTQKGKNKPPPAQVTTVKVQPEQPIDKKQRKKDKKEEEKRSRKVHKERTADKPKYRSVTPPPRVKPAKAVVPTDSVRKRRKKSRKSKSTKKARVSQPQSSTNESQSTESSPDVPTTSSRIGKIPNGKRYQRMAMAKAKRLGNVVDGSIPPLIISKALKVVKTAHFNIQPDHAFRDYHRVFGTQLPHVQKLFGDIQSRYGSVLTETSELELNLAHQHDTNKVVLIKPDAGTSYTTLWQFQNDMLRSAPVEGVTGSVDGAVASSSKTVTEVDFKDLPALRGTPARKEVAKDFNGASAFADRSKKGTKDPSARASTKGQRKKRKKHSSEVNI